MPQLSDYEGNSSPSKNEGFETVVKNVSQCSVNLTKNTKGYGWEIKAYADSMNKAIDMAIAADLRLRTQFGGGQSE